jgi:hypothetical protein
MNEYNMRKCNTVTITMTIFARPVHTFLSHNKSLIYYWNLRCWSHIEKNIYCDIKKVYNENRPNIVHGPTLTGASFSPTSEVLIPRHFVMIKAMGLKMCTLTTTTPTILDDGDSRHHWNLAQCLPDYKLQHPRRQLEFIWFEYGPLLGSCEHGNKPSSSIWGGIFLAR